MREIKFRLIEDGKIVGYEKWYPGEKHPSDSGMTGWVAKPHWLYSYNNEAWGIIYIPHDGKEQFADLKDKNDVEIYDGDVFRYYPDLYNSIHIVEWGLPIGARLIKKGSARWPEQYLHCMASRNIEIIGTIHDKPEKNTNQGSESARDSVGPADSEK